MLRHSGGVLDAARKRQHMLGMCGRSCSYGQPASGAQDSQASLEFQACLCTDVPCMLWNSILD